MKSPLTLRTRLVALVIAAVVPLLGLSVVKAVLNTDAAVAQATRELESAATLAAASQMEMTESAKQILSAIANVPGLTEMPVADCQRYFKKLNDELAIYVNLGVIGVDGYMRCHGLDLGALKFVGDRAYFQAALASRAFVADGVVVGRASGRPIVTFAAPTFNTQGAMSAVVFVAMDLAELSKAMSRVSLPDKSRMVIMDRQGMTLAIKPDRPENVGKLAPSPMMLPAIKAGKKSVFEGPDSQGVQRIFAFVPSAPIGSAPFFVSVSIPLDAVLAPAQRLLTLELLVLALVAFLGSWLAWGMGGRMIVRPTAAILDATARLESGQMDARVPIAAGQSSLEFNRIAEGFNRMAASLEARERDQALSHAELLEAQRKLFDAQRLGRIGHWEMDVQTQRLLWSDELHALFGLSPETFDGRHETFIQMLHPQDRLMYDQRRKQSLLGSDAFDTEYRIITPAGNVRWMHQRGQWRPGKNGQPDYRAGVVQDITDRKTSELALAHSTELLRSTGEMARVGGWELRVDGTQLDYSEQLLDIYEMAPGTTLTIDSARRAFPQDARRVLTNAVRSAIENGTPWDFELPMVTAKGRAIWVRSQGKAVFHQGKAQRLTGALQDITAQHDSREHLRLLETSISRLNDIVLITEAEPFDEPGPCIVFVNDAFERQTGYSRAEVMGKSPRFLQGPKTQRAELDRLSAALKKWQPFKAELINYKKNGEEFWIELDIVPIAKATGGFSQWVAVGRDITQRKLAEQALIESEQRYTALFDSAPVSLWVYDEDSLKFLAVNGTAIKVYGYSVEEFMSMSLFDIRPDSEHGALRKQLAGASDIKKDCWLHRRKDGSLFSVRVADKPIRFAGRAAGFVVALDVTAQQRAEQDVLDHLFTLQRAGDATQAITLHQTLDGMLQEIADQARGVIGAHQAVVNLVTDGNWAQATHVLSLSDKYEADEIDDADRDLVVPTYNAGIYAMAGGGKQVVRVGRAELETHQRGRGVGGFIDGHPEMCGWLAVPLTGRNGKNIGMLQLSDKYEGDFTVQDEYVAVELAQIASIAIENAKLLEEINHLNAGLEQKVAERTAALTRQEALFRALADQAPQVVWTASPEGQVTYLNRAWFDLAGGELADWTGNQWFAAIHPDDLPDAMARWKIAIAEQSQYVGERRLRVKDGSYHTMSYRASAVLDMHGKVEFWVGIDADITEIKTVEAALRLSNQELEAFSYSVSHDLRSPLNTIDGFCRLLAKQLSSQEGDKERHYMSRIQAGAAQMGRLIEDLLSLAQVSRIQLRHELVDISALGTSIVEEHQARQPERQVQVQVEAGLHAYGDGRLIRVVLENLIGNAWKFTSKTEQASIGVGHYVDVAGNIVFFVRDNGAGFDMAYADKLFTAFQRLHGAMEFPGTGIGLATASRVIRRHGGLLWPEASLDCGATFFFTLPQMAGSV